MIRIKNSPPITFNVIINHEGELNEKLGHLDLNDGRVVIYDDPITKTILVDYDLIGRQTIEIKDNCVVLDMNLLKLPTMPWLIVGSLKENILGPFPDPPIVVASNLLTVIGTLKSSRRMFSMGKFGIDIAEKQE